MYPWSEKIDPPTIVSTFGLNTKAIHYFSLLRFLCSYFVSSDLSDNTKAHVSVIVSSFYFSFILPSNYIPVPRLQNTCQESHFSSSDGFHN